MRRPLRAAAAVPLAVATFAACESTIAPEATTPPPGASSAVTTFVAEGTTAELLALLLDDSREHLWRRVRIETRHTHGTGCTLSAAITACLARGASLGGAVDSAVRYVAKAIEHAPGLGSGHGPINHLVAPE